MSNLLRARESFCRQRQASRFDLNVSPIRFRSNRSSSLPGNCLRPLATIFMLNPGSRILAASLCLASLVVAFTGCGSRPADFKLNTAVLFRLELEYHEQFSAQKLKELDEVLVALFGTPDDPHVPTLSNADVKELLDPKKLKMAAGPVGRDELGRRMGLYREHCAHCHGISGDGAGPTAALLNPYPRDYRKGVFKFKSTPIGKKPTRDDLGLILTNGIPDTAMPSFKLLPEDELESIIQYVQYLALRGEVERLLIDELAELSEEEALTSADEDEMVRNVVSGVFASWMGAADEATMIPAPDGDVTHEVSVRLGRELFYGPVAGCVKCHGDSALGDGDQPAMYDDWTKDVYNPSDEKADEHLAQFRKLDTALEPRQIRPRDLRRQAFRGGHRPIDIFRRVRNGIDGTGMPAAASDLSDQQVWHLVAYVRSLRFEPLSRPAVSETDYQRHRQ